jgi:energy-coupling factor transporter ATP-binding protein EcfA2
MPTADNKAEVRCFESGWCDYSSEHRRVREEAERLIENYVKGGSDEYWMTVIVAPYGSGKSTLLKHLHFFSERKLNARASIVEFADIVNYIVEHYGTIHESALPNIVEEYVRERFGEWRGVFVLLIDEIEESYDLFRGVIEHETSPLRGLAEAVRTHRLRVYPVLAFGPSSTLKEAVFGPVAWRSRVLTIPLIPKPVIAALLGVKEPRLRQLVANTIWWASKGRAAWVNMLVEQLADRLVSAARQGPEKLEALLLSEELLTREILEGVPLFDRSGYRDIKRFVENKKLLPYLSAFVGPLPVKLLEEWLGEPIVPEAGPVYGFTRSFIDADELVGEASAWMERIARSRGAPGTSVEHAITALEHVVYAWSLDGKLPYDMQALRELFSIAADLAREIYGDDPESAQLIESLNPDLVAPEVIRGEIVAYIRPSMLSRIYPTATSNPLLGCARRAGAAQVVNVVESLAPEELVSYSGEVARLPGVDEILAKHGARLVVAPLRLLPALRESLCNSRSILLVIDAREEASTRGLPQWLQVLGKAGIVAAATVGQRLSMFLYSMLYDLAISTPTCSLERLEPRDRRLLGLYGDNVKTLILDALHSLTAGSGVELEKLVERLRGRYGDAGVAAAARLALMSQEAVEKIRALYTEAGKRL